MSGMRPANRGNRSANRTGTAVSRKLRAAGFNIAPSALRHLREVTTVSAYGDNVSILVDMGLAAKNRRYSGELVAELLGWPQATEISAKSTQSGAVFIHFSYATLAVLAKQK